jgi:predicted transcriptional regulator
MKPIDLRNETWADVMNRVDGDRCRVHLMLAQSGPCTVRELAAHNNQDVLSIAPRITELFELGFVELVGRKGRRGVYKAVSALEAENVFKARRSAAVAQPELPLKEG